MKKFFLFLNLILSLSFLFSCSQNRYFLTTRERSWLTHLKRPLRVAVNPSFTPFAFINKDQTIDGISVDYLKLIEKQLGIRFKPVLISNQQQKLQKTTLGNIDIWLKMVPFPASQGLMYQTTPYTEIKIVFISRTDEILPPDYHPSSGTTTIAVEGSYVAKRFHRLHPHTPLLSVRSPLKALRAVQDKTAQIFVSDLSTAAYLMNKYHLGTLKVQAASEIEPLRLSFGSRKDLPLLASILQKTLNRISAKEKYTIYNKWFGIEKTISATLVHNKNTFLNVSTLGIAIPIFLGIFWTVVLFFTLFLKKQDTNFLSTDNQALLIFVLISSILLVYLSALILLHDRTEKPLILSQEEQKWLILNDNKLILAPDAYFPPFEWIDKNKHLRGIAADYVQILEKKLHIHFKLKIISNWSENMQLAKEGKIDIWSAVASSPEREKFMSFTHPYLKLQSIFLVSKSVTNFSLKDIPQKRIAVVQNYFTHYYLKNHYPTVKLVLYPNSESALHALVFNQVDAAFMDITTASYYIRKNSLTSLKVAKVLNVKYNLAFASRKDLPILHQILEKAIRSVSSKEKRVILKKWFPFYSEPLLIPHQFPLFFSIGGSLLFFLLFLFILWNRSLQSQLRIKTKELQNNRDQLAMVLEASNDGILDFFPAESVIHFSPSWFIQLGYEPNSLPHTFDTLRSLLHPQDRVETLQKIQNYVNHPLGRLQHEFRLKTAKGKWKHILGRGKAVEISPTGKALHIIASHYDVTAVRQSEQENLHLKVLLNNILDSIDSVMIAVDNSFLITHWNRAAIFAFSLSSLEAEHQNLFSIVPQLKAYKSQIYDTMHKRKVLLLEDISLKLNGTTCHSRLSAYPMRQVKTPGLILQIDDISELKEKEHQLIHAQKMESIGILAGGLAHDFNNLLAGIIGTVSLMQFELKQKYSISTEDLKDNLKTIETAGDRAKVLVEQLLTLARKRTFSIKPINLTLILSNIQTLLSNSLDKSVSLDFRLPDHPCIVQGDAGQLEQSLLNFGINAIHAMTLMKPKTENWGGILRVEISKIIKNDLPYYCVSVHDNGIGMDANTISHIYTPFFTTKQKGQGSGLGMSMAYSIIRQQNGWINVQSKKGEGTEFKIFLPLYSESTVSTQIPDNTSSDKTVQTGEGVILIIDDESMIRKTATKILLSGGYTVITAQNGQKGIEIYKEKQNEIDLVLLDMVMPKMDGKETFKALFQINPKIKVIINSGFKNDPRVQNVLEKGASAFLQKPYRLEELLKVVKTSLYKDF